MGPTGPATVIIQIDLGAASAVDQIRFPLEYHMTDGDLNKGGVLIKATRDEMAKIAQLGVDLNKNEDFIYDTRVNIEALKEEKTRIQENRKALNPFKVYRSYQAARLFHKAAIVVYDETMQTSEKIRREEMLSMQVVPSSQMRRVEHPVSPNTSIVGVSVELPDGWDDNARQIIIDAATAITDPFIDDPLVSQLREGEQAITLPNTASLLSLDVHDPDASDTGQTSVASGSDLLRSRRTSPRVINIINIIRDSIFSTNSSLSGFTSNRDSSNTSGASVT